MSLKIMDLAKLAIKHLFTFLFSRSVYFIFILTLGCLGLSSCASSNVSREAASNVDMGVQNAKNLVSGDGDPMLSYQNSKQATKGAILGATAGAVTGWFTSGVGAIPGAATGMVLGASYGSYIDSQTSLEDKLVNRGATTVVLGDQILIVLPSSSLFEYQSARIKPQAYSTLDLVAQYINQYTNMMVKVGAYTADTGSKRVDLALSQQQASSVAKMLAASGVNTRVLYAMGYGGSKLVSDNTLDWDASDNYRVEITLEKLYV